MVPGFDEGVKEENCLGGRFGKMAEEIKRNDKIKAELSDRDKRFREESLNGNLWKVLLKVGTPLALYQSLSMVFKLLDTMMASHISSTSVSAVAYLGQISSLISAVGTGLAVGSGIRISRAYGEGDYLMVKKRVSCLYAICAGFGVLILAMILPFVDGFLKLSGTPGELIDVGREYFSVELLVIVVQMFNNVYISVERARGNSKRIMYLNFVVIGIKLSLTAFFVYILEGDLVMIAYASLISQLGMFVFGVASSLRGGSNVFGFSLRAVTMEKKVVLPMLSQSFPVMVEKIAFSMGKTLINAMSVVYGALTAGALGVSNNFGGITTSPQNGFQEGGAAIISQNMGAGKPERAIGAFKRVLVVNLVMGVVLLAGTLIFLDNLTSLFDGGDPAFHQLIMQVFHYEALGTLTLGINSAVLSLLYGLGKTKVTLAINFSRVFIFRVPVLWALQRFTGFGAESVGIVMMVSNVSVGVVAVIVAVVVIRNLRRQFGGSGRE